MYNLQDTIGTQLAFVTLRFVFLGVTTVQFDSFLADARSKAFWTRIWLTVVVVADGLNVIFWFIWLYYSLISSYGNPEAARVSDWGFLGASLTVAVVAVAVQMWYAARLWRLSSHCRAWSILGFLLSLASFTCSIPANVEWAITVAHGQHPTSSTIHRPTVVAWSCLSLATDLVLALPTAWQLFQLRREAGFRSTGHMLVQISIWVLISGLLTTALAAIVTVLCFTEPDGAQWVAIAGTMAATYSNSMLAFLNRRRKWAELGNENFLTESGEELYDTANIAHIESLPIRQVQLNSPILPHIVPILPPKR